MMAEPKKLRIVDRPVTNLRVTRKTLEQQAWYSVPSNLRHAEKDDHGNMRFYVKHSPSANRYADMTELHTMSNAELLKLRKWPADTVVTEGITMAHADQIVESLLSESFVVGNQTFETLGSAQKAAEQLARNSNGKTIFVKTDAGKIVKEISAGPNGLLNVRSR